MDAAARRAPSAALHPPALRAHAVLQPELQAKLPGQTDQRAALKASTPKSADTGRCATRSMPVARGTALRRSTSLHGGCNLSCRSPRCRPRCSTPCSAWSARTIASISTRVNALGHRKSAPHIKTNLFKFAPLYELFDRHKFHQRQHRPAAGLHERPRTARRHGLAAARWRTSTCWRATRTRQENPATLSSEHLQDMQALVDDIWFIHRELGFDMNQFNLMFAFGSELNCAAKGEAVLTRHARAATAAATRCTLPSWAPSWRGLRRHWFSEFTPGYCTKRRQLRRALHLLQSDGSVYSCVRGQGIPEFRYGNVFSSPSPRHPWTTARAKSARCTRRTASDSACGAAATSPPATGCPVVKHQKPQRPSHTCGPAKTHLRRRPFTYPADPPDVAARLRAAIPAITHPSLAFARPAAPARCAPLVLPNDLGEEKNTCPHSSGPTRCCRRCSLTAP